MRWGLALASADASLRSGRSFDPGAAGSRLEAPGPGVDRLELDRDGPGRSRWRDGGRVGSGPRRSGVAA